MDTADSDWDDFMADASEVPRGHVTADDIRALLKDLVHHHEGAAVAASTLKDWLATLNDLSAKSDLLTRVDQAAARLEVAVDYIEKAIIEAKYYTTSERLILLLREFYSQPNWRDEATFESTLSHILFEASLPGPRCVLHDGKLTNEEVDALRSCARDLGIWTHADAAPVDGLSVAALAEWVENKGRPDIRTAFGKARIDLYPPAPSRDASAAVVAARILHRVARRITQIEASGDVDLRHHGDLFTMETATVRPKRKTSKSKASMPAVAESQGPSVKQGRKSGPTQNAPKPRKKAT